MSYGPGDRLPDPSWKSGPPDPPQWTVHGHEFDYGDPDVEVIDGYVYVHQQCRVDDGHPYDPQRCGAKRHITYMADDVYQMKKDSASGEYISAPVDPRGPHQDVYREVVRAAEDIIMEDPFRYDILEQSDFEVEVDLDIGSFVVRFKHDGTEVHEW